MQTISHFLYRNRTRCAKSNISISEPPQKPKQLSDDDLVRSVANFMGCRAQLCSISKQVQDLFKTIKIPFAPMARSDSPPLVLLCGEVNTGKSSIGNLILSKRCFPSRMTPSTSCITILQAGSVAEVTISTLTNKILDKHSLSLDKKGPLIAEADVVADKRADLTQDSAAYVYVTLPGIPLLEAGMTIVDSPGLNEFPALSQFVLDMFSKASAIIYVFNATRGVTEADQKSFQRIKFLEEKQQHRFQLFFIVNFFFDLDENEEPGVQKRIMSQIHTELCHFFPSRFKAHEDPFCCALLHPLSAKSALLLVEQGQTNENIMGFKKKLWDMLYTMHYDAVAHPSTSLLFTLQSALLSSSCAMQELQLKANLCTVLDTMEEKSSEIFSGLNPTLAEQIKTRQDNLVTTIKVYNSTDVMSFASSQIVTVMYALLEECWGIPFFKWCETAIGPIGSLLSSHLKHTAFSSLPETALKKSFFDNVYYVLQILVYGKEIANTLNVQKLVKKARVTELEKLLHTTAGSVRKSVADEIKNELLTINSLLGRTSPERQSKNTLDFVAQKYFEIKSILMTLEKGPLSSLPTETDHWDDEDLFGKLYSSNWGTDDVYVKELSSNHEPSQLFTEAALFETRGSVSKKMLLSVVTKGTKTYVVYDKASYIAHARAARDALEQLNYLPPLHNFLADVPVESIQRACLDLVPLVPNISTLISQCLNKATYDNMHAKHPQLTLVCSTKWSAYVAG